MLKNLVVMDCPPNSVYVKYLLGPRSIYFWTIFFFQLPYLPELFFTAHDMEKLDRMYMSKQSGFHNLELLGPTDIQVYKTAFAEKNAWTAAINYYRAKLSYPVLARSIAQLLTGKAETIETKTLIIWGEDDYFLSKKVAYESLKVCKNIASEVNIVHGSSHWVQQNAPDAVNESIKIFLGLMKKSDAKYNHDD